MVPDAYQSSETSASVTPKVKQTVWIYSATLTEAREGLSKIPALQTTLAESCRLNQAGKTLHASKKRDVPAAQPCWS